MASNPWLDDVAPERAADRAAGYAARFDRLAAEGHDVHGEATLVHALVRPGSVVVDAGAGTGRVGIRLAELGHVVVGVDIDPAMVAEARRRAPRISWHCADLADLDRGDDPLLIGGASAVVAAGNVMPLLSRGAEDATVRRLAGLLRPGGLLIAGFGLDDAHLPRSAPADARFRDLAAYDAAGTAAGLVLIERWSAWDRQPFTAGDGYAVSVHRATGAVVSGR